MSNKKKNIRKHNISQLMLSLIIIVLLNIISSFVFTRFDLTSEKRYTLSDATKKMLKGLDDVVFFKVYLDGEFPAGFKRLRNETKEMLNQFRAYTDNIEYEFINPLENPDKKIVKNIYQQLVNKGLEPTNLQVKNADGSSQQIIFPGAIVSYKGKEMPLQLLINQIGVPPEAVLNNSVQSLEYNLASTIKKLCVRVKPKVAFIEDHGELDKLHVGDIMYALSEYYTVERVKIDEKIYSLTNRNEADSGDIKIKNKYNAIIIAKPDSAFSERDKFIIDQFIMRGGKVLWLIDPVFASMDSLQYAFETIGLGLRLNLDDILFRYGVRLNTNLLLDLNALPIPAQIGTSGGERKFGLLPWFYSPIITPVIKHPVVNNLNSLKCEFVSRIDTVGNDNIRKTILLTTSRYTKVINTPARISLDILYNKPIEEEYNKPYQPIAVLLEGEFESVFKNRITPEIQNSKEIGFLEKSKPTSMIVVADGDIIKNQLQFSEGNTYPLPLGYDKYTQQTFGNKDFILNAVNYLCDDSGLISIRTRELKLRLLDRTKISNSTLTWQLVNTIIPILLIVIFGIIQHIIRKRKYTKVISD